jgi:pimeloyl-ACP methyl ester carboxylesterase
VARHLHQRGEGGAVPGGRRQRGVAKVVGSCVAPPDPIQAAALGWQTLGRLVIAAGPPTTRLLLRMAGRRIMDAERTAITDPGAVSGGRANILGRVPSRVSPAQVDLWLDGLDAARGHPERLAGAATAFASITRTMFITQRSTNQALDAVRVPVLVLWGTDDPLVARRTGLPPLDLVDEAGEVW